MGLWLSLWRTNARPKARKMMMKWKSKFRSVRFIRKSMHGCSKAIMTLNPHFAKTMWTTHLKKRTNLNQKETNRYPKKSSSRTMRSTMKKKTEKKTKQS